MISQTEIQIDVLPTQGDFISSQERYALYSGGVGSGKTYSLLIILFKYVTKYPGINVLVVSGTWPQLRDTFYREFTILFPEMYIDQHNRTTHTVTTKNGSTIFFRSFDKPEKIGSYTTGLILAEELTTISEESFKMLRTRNRQADMPGHFRAVCNPGSFSSWVYKNFIEKPIVGSEVLFGSSHENQFLPQEYLDDLVSLKKTNPSYYKRMVLGMWGKLEGLVYDLPKEQRSLPFEPSFETVICGVDFGYTNPSAFVVIAIEGEKHFVCEVIYRYKLNQKDFVDISKKIIKDFNVSTFYCDSAEPGTIEAMAQEGIPAEGAYKAKDSVKYGISLIQTLIGQKRLFVDQSCVSLLREFDSYVWRDQEGSEVPLKANDHCLDALRYALATSAREKDDIDHDFIKEYYGIS